MLDLKRSSVALPRGVVGWFAVCACGTFLIILTYNLNLSVTYTSINDDEHN